MQVKQVALTVVTLPMMVPSLKFEAWARVLTSLSEQSGGSTTAPASTAKAAARSDNKGTYVISKCVERARTLIFEGGEEEFLECCVF